MAEFEGKGIGVSAGRVIAPVRRIAPAPGEPAAHPRLADDAAVQAASASLDAAVAAVTADLLARRDKASGAAREVLEATAQMAEDPALIEGARGRITGEKTPADRAVWEAAAELVEMLEQIGGMMAERATDVRDVRSRLIAVLRNEPLPGIPESDTPFILVAEDLAPADTAALNPEIVVGLATSGGGPQSHTAILARSIGLPATVAMPGVDELPEGTEVYLDGGQGMVSTVITDEYRHAAAAWAELRENPLSYSGGGAHTADRAMSVQLLANIGGSADAQVAAQAGADGVGLFRTEFLFLDRQEEPSVEEQVAAYTEVFSHFPGKKVVVRTLDAGADKPLPFLTSPDEPNPALGVRGLRTSWRRPEVLRNQIRAIAQAAQAAEAEPWVMAPMIATMPETEEFVALCAEHGVRTAGIMVETPAAALTSQHLLRSAAFASIGTNDLTQYTMAADRMVGDLATLNDPWQPAVLSLIKTTCDGSGERPVGVCGEAAGDPAMAVVLLGLGVNSLSMSARSLAEVAHVIASVDADTVRECARLALEAPDAATGRAAVHEKLPALADVGL